MLRKFLPAGGLIQDKKTFDANIPYALEYKNLEQASL
jgi:hypothetical protein